MLKLYTNNVDWVIATSAERAREISVTVWGEGANQGTFRELPDDEIITLEDGQIPDSQDGDDILTAKEWVQVYNTEMHVYRDWRASV